MILLDPREGSVDLFAHLEALGLNVKLQTLESADVAFTGNGPQGEGCAWIGVERKRVRDMLGSIRSGRFSGHQLPNLVHQYDFPFLLIEGSWRPSEDDEGLLEEGWPSRPVVIGKSRFLYREFSRFQFTIQVAAQVPVLRSSSRHETAHLIRDLWVWFNQKSWSEHRAHMAFNLTSDIGHIEKPGLVRRVAKELPGIGWEKSHLVEDEFGTVLEMAQSWVADDERRWASIHGELKPDGRRRPGIGKVIAKRVMAAIRGELKEKL